MTGRLVWLASYPKSGSTWMRAILTAFRRPDRPVDLHDLIGAGSARDADQFEELVGLRYSELPPGEQAGLLPLFARRLAEEANSITYRKTHDAIAASPGAPPIFTGAAGARALYIVRDPRDVAVSFAHHRGVSIDEIIAVLDDPGASIGRAAGDAVEHLGRWSDHVAGWLDQDYIPVHAVRYEDLARRPLRTVCAALGFAGEAYSVERAARAVDAARFDRLQRQEAETGYAERSAKADRFFRKGRAGDWRSVLTAKQAKAVECSHGGMMRRMGYLPPL